MPNKQGHLITNIHTNSFWPVFQLANKKWQQQQAKKLGHIVVQQKFGSPFWQGGGQQDNAPWWFTPWAKTIPLKCHHPMQWRCFVVGMLWAWVRSLKKYLGRRCHVFYAVESTSTTSCGKLPFPSSNLDKSHFRSKPVRSRFSSASRR